MEEIRKEIPWLPKGKYYVSNLGRVKNGNVKTKKGKILKLESNRYGHQRVKLYGEGGGNDVKHYQVHRLVYCVFNDLDYWFGLDAALSESTGLVLHKDNNPLNNRLDNLYMGTQKENMNQCVNEGRFVFIEPRLGEKNGNNKYPEALIREFKQRIKDGENSLEVGRDLGINESTIYDITEGKTWNRIK